MAPRRYRGIPNKNIIDDINKRINDKVSDVRVDPYSSKNYKFLTRLYSEPLEKYSDERLKRFKDAVINMNPGSDDPEYIQRFTNARYSILNKIDQELDKRKSKSSVIHLPSGSQLDMFSIFENDLVEKASQIETRLHVNAEDIIKVCSGSITTTLDFIRFADRYLESGSDFDLKELIDWMKSYSIFVSTEPRDLVSTFIKDFAILIAEYIEVQFNLHPDDSYNHAKTILQEAFMKSGFEQDLYDLYKSTSDGKYGSRVMEVAKLLVHYDIFDDSLIIFFRSNL